MAEMTDPSHALTSFQLAYQNGELTLERGRIDSSIAMHFDQPNGKARFTYVSVQGKEVTALAILAFVTPIDGVPCFQLGYAVAPKFQRQGRAKKIANAAIAELRNGLLAKTGRSFHVEAVVGTSNIPSQRVAMNVFGVEPEAITDEVSGSPALHYKKRVEGQT